MPGAATGLVSVLASVIWWWHHRRLPKERNLVIHQCRELASRAIEFTMKRLDRSDGPSPTLGSPLVNPGVAAMWHGDCV